MYIMLSLPGERFRGLGPIWALNGYYMEAWDLYGLNVGRVGVITAPRPVLMMMDDESSSTVIMMTTTTKMMKK